jgi:MerR family mercuric resistance operon transcriptional regulator
MVELHAMPDASYTIGALARAANVPVSTVRFYERRGILRPEGRSHANYRRYSNDSLQKLRLIRCAQNIGLSLKDARELLKLIDSENCPCDDVEQIVRRRLDDVRARIKELRRWERALDKSLRVCCGGKETGVCETIIRLNRGACTPSAEFCTTCP